MDIYLKLDEYLTKADNVEKLSTLFENSHHATRILSILKKTLNDRNTLLPNLEKVTKVLSVPGVKMPKKEEEHRALQEKMERLEIKLKEIMGMETLIRIPGQMDNVKNLAIGSLLKSIVPTVRESGVMSKVSETA